VEIFELGGPVTPQPRLDARTDRPTVQIVVEVDEIGRHRVGEVRICLVHAAPSRTCGDVKQIAIIGPAKPYASSGEPVEPLAHGVGGEFAGAEIKDAIQRASRVILAGPLDIAFATNHHIAELPIVADLAAEHAATRRDRRGGQACVTAQDFGEGIVAKTITAVDAGIKPGPAPRRRRRRRRLDRHVGSHSHNRQAEQEKPRQNEPLHR
jgi:hypothetical protein